MKKTILAILVFCLSVFSLILGVVLFSMSNSRLGIIPGSIAVGLGIWGLKWSLTTLLVSTSKIFKSHKKEEIK